MIPRKPQKHILNTVARKPVNKSACYVNQKHQGKPLLFHDKCSALIYVHYFNNLAHGTYGTLTSHPKDEAIMVKCLAQGHKRRHPGLESDAPDRSATKLRPNHCTRKRA